MNKTFTTGCFWFTDGRVLTREIFEDSEGKWCIRMGRKYIRINDMQDLWKWTDGVTIMLGRWMKR